MNIAMFTNDYEPIIGGVTRSISTFSEDLRAMGHRVLIVTLMFPGAEDSDVGTFRLPAVKEVGGTQFSVRIPVPAGLKQHLDDFSPDIIHSHHPFMLGDTALRVARRRCLPIVFTHHTLYERYTYLFSQESRMLESIAEAIGTEYANLCDSVIAPTQSIKSLITGRGVVSPIEVIPTGIDVDLYASGDRERCRAQYDIPQDAFVLGYLGRVVEAKNLVFLTQAVISFLEACPDAWFLVVGEGESIPQIRHDVAEADVTDRVVFTGSLEGQDAADAYAAMDLFGFASKTETQGIVLIESLCAGVPIVALDASGTRDIVEDGKNGMLLHADAAPQAFSAALMRLRHSPDTIKKLRHEARRSALAFERRHCAHLLVEAYGSAIQKHVPRQQQDDVPWQAIQARFSTECELFREKLSVIAEALAIKS